jgi:threonine dehydrogenase-like Zn-dependent dehydrogenase
MGMNANTRVGLGAVMMTTAADAMAHAGPHPATWIVVWGAGALGFAAGLLWCHLRDKRKKGNQPNDR